MNYDGSGDKEYQRESCVWQRVGSCPSSCCLSSCFPMEAAMTTGREWTPITDQILLMTVFRNYCLSRISGRNFPVPVVKRSRVCISFVQLDYCSKVFSEGSLPKQNAIATHTAHPRTSFCTGYFLPPFHMPSSVPSFLSPFHHRFAVIIIIMIIM